jgi:hypothetical protein
MISALHAPQHDPDLPPTHTHFAGPSALPTTNTILAPAAVSHSLKGKERALAALQEDHQEDNLTSLVDAKLERLGLRTTSPEGGDALCFRPFRNEGEDLPGIMRLVEQELSEP